MNEELRNGENGSRGPASVNAAAGVVRLNTFLLATILVVVPWLNGGVDPLPHMFFGLSCAVLGCGIAWQAVRTGNRLHHVALTPLLLGMALMVLQLLPIYSDDSQRTAAARLRSSVWSTVPMLHSSAGPSVVLGRIPHSLFPAATRMQLCDLVLCTILFLAGAMVLGDAFRRRLICWLVCINGAAISIVGILHRFSDSQRFLWTFDLTSGGKVFGPFVYRNLAGNYLAVAVGCGLVLLTTMLTDAWRTRSSAHSSNSSLVARMLRVPYLLALLATVFSCAGLLFTFSRGAVGSCCIAAIVLAGCLMRTTDIRTLGVGIGVVGASVAAVLVSYEMAPSVVDRFGSLIQIDTYEDQQRLQHWSEMTEAANTFALAGSGFGSYHFVCRTFAKTSNPDFQHAHNQYLEALVDGGVPALLLVLAQVGVVAYYAIRQLTTSNPQRDTAATAGLVAFVLVLQSCHAGVDYCLYLPSSMMTAAIFSGIALSSGIATRRNRPTRFGVAPFAGAVAIAGITAATSIASYEWSSYEITRVDWAAPLDERTTFVDDLAVLDGRSGDLQDAVAPIGQARGLDVDHRKTRQGPRRLTDRGVAGANVGGLHVGQPRWSV